ncbi:MAG: proton-conducting transporter membrane subunit [Acidimicrobiales bacterium]
MCWTGCGGSGVAAGVLVAIVVVPFAAGLVAWITPTRLAQAVTVGAGVATFALSLVLVAAAGTRGEMAVGGWLRADALSLVFLLSTTFLYAVTAVFSVGYLHGGDDPADDARYARRLYAGLNFFCWAMAITPVVNSLVLVWAALEIASAVSALLVAIDGTDGAAEASWKYLLIASMGLGIALFGTVAMYAAGAAALGPAYRMAIGPLLASAHRLPAGLVRLAYLLAVLGFGTKMGLVPVHTWLPDAHSEAPTPVSALLSGSLLAVSFYAILRYFQITGRALGYAFPREVLLAFGIASLTLAALYVVSQRDLKRLLAYSSIEHMGIMAIGMSFAAPLAVVGVLIQVMAHAAAKGTAFFGAGSVMRKLGTKDLRRIRGGIGLLPWTGPMLVLAVLALSAAPPFGIFRSELMIVAGGLSVPSDGTVAVLVGLVTLAFLGLSWWASQTMLSPTPRTEAEAGAPAGGRPVPVASGGADTGPPAGPVALGDPEPGAGAGSRLTKGETSAWMVGAMLAGLGALVLLGVHPPGSLDHLLSRAAAELGVGR